MGFAASAAIKGAVSKDLPPAGVGGAAAEGSDLARMGEGGGAACCARAMVCRRWRPWKQQIEEGRAVDLEQQREPGREGRKTERRWGS